jgi:thiamine-monophosphate kinase
VVSYGLVINFLKEEGLVLGLVRKLSNIGERQAIRLIDQILAKGGSSDVLGDDCAALSLGRQYLLVTTDLIARHTHMPSGMTPYQTGWMLTAVNLSDIAAKGGTPLGLVVTYGLPPDTTDVFLKEMTRGAMTCARRCGTRIVGGDTKEAADITLSGTAFGLVNKTEFMPRKGCHPGDVIAVTGTLGKAAAGYTALQHKETQQSLTRGLFEPWPRLKEGRLLAKRRIVTSSMDLSDGLSASLYQLQELNPVGFTIQSNLLPVSKELQTMKRRHPEIDTQRLLLHFGADYELLVTLPATKFQGTATALKRQGCSLTRVGTVTKSKKILLDDGNKTQVLPNEGWEHFTPHPWGPLP